MFCPHCNILTDEKRCPYCGNKDIHKPNPDDYCFLTEQDQIWAGMLSDVFEQNEIPFITRSVLGAGITAKIGPLMERIRFYVPYSRFDTSHTLVCELFNASPME